MFIYYNERVIEHSVEVDSGAELRDGMKAIARWGSCAEPFCPYVVSDFRKKPLQKAYRAAAKHKITNYSRVPQLLEHMKTVLSTGDSFAFGFSVYESFESQAIAKTGMMPIPAPHEILLGGHAVLCCGYDDTKQVMIIRNSWSDQWGDKGYFYMPYSFIVDDDYCADFWTVQFVPV